MDKKIRVVSGIRASGKLHLGNYLGALKQYLEIQDRPNSESLFFIADLHALTSSFSPKSLRENTLEVAAEYLASGLDPNKNIIFLQSLVPAHSELAWIFNCITPIAELERMTQYKDKSKTEKSINAGLLTYPALMASDILLYKPDFVPVGEDQLQHLELTRIIVRKFNRAFGNTFPEPQSLEKKSVRIMSLSSPEKKMSKTNDEPLYISDSPETILKKIKKAVTASSANRSPGTDNLFYLLSQFAPHDIYTHFLKEEKSGTLKYSELKQTLAEYISNYFSEFRERKEKLMSDKPHLAEILWEGAKKANKMAEQTLAEVKEKIGLL